MTKEFWNCEFEWNAKWWLNLKKILPQPKQGMKQNTRTKRYKGTRTDKTSKTLNIKHKNVWTTAYLTGHEFDEITVDIIDKDMFFKKHFIRRVCTWKSFRTKLLCGFDTVEHFWLLYLHLYLYQLHLNFRAQSWEYHLKARQAALKVAKVLKVENDPTYQTIWQSIKSEKAYTMPE